MRWWRGCGRGVAGGGAMASVHGHVEALGGDGGSVLRPSSERARERVRGAREGECGIGVLLSPSWT
jgi:hypothetical protein